MLIKSDYDNFVVYVRPYYLKKKKTRVIQLYWKTFTFIVKKTFVEIEIQRSMSYNFFFFQKRHNLKEHVKFVKMYKISKASQICDNNDHLKWYYNSNSLDSITGILWWTILKNKNSGLYFSTKNYYTFLFNDWSVVCGKSFFLSFPRKFLVGRVFEHTRNPKIRD